MGLKWWLPAAALVAASFFTYTLWPRADTPAPRPAERQLEPAPRAPARTTPPEAVSTPAPPHAITPPPSAAMRGAAGLDTAHGIEPRASRARKRLRAEPVPAAAPADDSALQHELRIIAAVDDLIRRKRFDEALQLLEQGERDPKAVRLREERSALRVLASCGKGASPAILQQRERFLLSTPNAVLAARVREACGAGGSEHR
jgi:hypothetical protein